LTKLAYLQHRTADLCRNSNARFGQRTTTAEYSSLNLKYANNDTVYYTLGLAIADA